LPVLDVRVDVDSAEQDLTTLGIDDAADVGRVGDSSKRGERITWSRWAGGGARIGATASERGQQDERKKVSNGC